LRLQDCNPVAIEEQYRQLYQLAEQELREISGDCDMHAQYSVDLRYQGQSYTLNLLWDSAEELEYAFHELHESQYGHRMDIDVELVNLRLRLTGEKPAFDLPEWQPTQEEKPDTASVYGCDEPVRVYARETLRAGHTVYGPALITETSSTTWIDKGWLATVDHWGNLLLRASISRSDK
jgi:N-methylhydantoinase A